jgi:hypothetical protein
MNFNYFDDVAGMAYKLIGAARVCLSLISLFLILITHLSSYDRTNTQILIIVCVNFLVIDQVTLGAIIPGLAHMCVVI